MYSNSVNPDSDMQRGEKFLLTFHVLRFSRPLYQILDGR